MLQLPFSPYCCHLEHFSLLFIFLLLLCCFFFFFNPAVKAKSTTEGSVRLSGGSWEFSAGGEMTCLGNRRCFQPDVQARWLKVDLKRAWRVLGLLPVSAPASGGLCVWPSCKQSFSQHILINELKERSLNLGQAGGVNVTPLFVCRGRRAAVGRHHLGGQLLQRLTQIGVSLRAVTSR